MISMDPEYHFRFEVVDGDLEFFATPTWCVFVGSLRTEAVEFLEEAHSLQPSGTVVEGVVRLSDDHDEITEVVSQVRSRGDGR